MTPSQTRKARATYTLNLTSPKKLGNIPTGGGWRFVGRSQGQKNRHLMSGTKRSRYHQPLLGHAYVHTVVDDHSRVAYAEIHDDETADTAVAVLRRAVGWFSDRGVIVEAVLSDIQAV